MLSLLLVSEREGAREQVAGEAYLRRVPSRLNVPRQAVKIGFSGRRCSDELGVNWLLVLVVVDRVLAPEVAIELPNIFDATGAKRRGYRQRPGILRLE